eukprot:6864334-Pyramimonas_sp.AAC.1
MDMWSGSNMIYIPEKKGTDNAGKPTCSNECCTIYAVRPTMCYLCGATFAAQAMLCKPDCAIDVARLTFCNM